MPQRSTRAWMLLAVAGVVLLVGALAVLSGSAPGPGPSNSSVAAQPTLEPTPTATPVQTASPGHAATARPTLTPSPTRPVLPSFAHVFVIVMENKEASSIIGNGEAPYINDLANEYGLASNYTAVSHPSEPNYLALWSGSTHGVTDDGLYDFTSGSTLADQIQATGRTWHVAAQNVPLGCYGGTTASDGEDGTGTYARKHEPAISWTSVAGNPTHCANITDFSHFDPTLGSFWLIVPNLCNDMHDCSIATGDAFLRGFLPRILTSSAFANSVIFLTWDEGSTATGGGGRVATVVISPLGKPAFVSSTNHSHYSLLHTIEKAWGMPCLANACAANDLREFFR
jgi:phosphatidylinositol-3-phosphatase